MSANSPAFHSLVVVGVLTLASGLAGRHADAGLGEDCIERLELKSEQLIAGVEKTLSLKETVENHHMQVSRAWTFSSAGVLKNRRAYACN